MLILIKPKRDSNGHCTEITLTDKEALDFLKDHILGEDWYVVDPMPNKQVNPFVVNDIIEKYNRAQESLFSKVKRLLYEAFK